MSIIHLGYGFFFFLLWKFINVCLLSPFLTLWKLRKNGLRGPMPSFPMGNLGHMKKMLIKGKFSSSSSSGIISHDIHSSSLPYFSQWKGLHGTYRYEFLYIRFHQI